MLFRIPAFRYSVSMNNDSRQAARRDDVIKNHYLPRMTPGRPHHDILNWAAAETQLERFAVLPRFVDVSGKHILDVGCGLGDLAEFLRVAGYTFEYTGVDILSAMVDRAAELHPEDRFVHADLFGDAPTPLTGETFDIVYTSGAMNLNLGNNMAFVAHALPNLYAFAEEVLVANFLSTRQMDREETYYYYEPDEILALARSFCRRVDLIDDYLPNDFTILCRRDG